MEIEDNFWTIWLCNQESLVTLFISCFPDNHLHDDTKRVHHDDAKRVEIQGQNDQLHELISKKKTEQNSILVKPDAVFQLLSDARNFKPPQESFKDNKHKYETNPYPKSLYASTNFSSYAVFLLLILFVCCVIIFGCLGGCSSFKNLALVLMYRGKAGRLHWSKNGYTLIPQVNHKSA